MKKIVNELLDEIYYQEILDNKLEVIIVHKPEFVSTSCAFGSAFGSLNIRQRVNGEEINFNSGLAHFLEHKLFESDDEDIMVKFNKMGIFVNAYTSFDYTIYHFNTSKLDIEKPINLLLDFVQQLNISDESIEKEKGIIKQELIMYDNNINFLLYKEVLNRMYNQHPIRYDIGGDIDSISKITKKELEDAYNINYHPSNMKFVVTTGVDPYKIIDIIKKNQSKKSFVCPNNIINYYQEIDRDIKENYHVINRKVNKEVLVYGFKLNYKFVDQQKSYKDRLALNILFEMIFNEFNPDYINWVNDNIIDMFYSFSLELGNGYAHLLFFNSCTKENEFIELIDKLLSEINDLLVQDEQIEFIKKRILSSKFNTMNVISDLNDACIKAALMGLSFYDNIKIIKEIDKNYILNLFNQLDFNNKILVKVKK